MSQPGVTHTFSVNNLMVNMFTGQHSESKSSTRPAACNHQCLIPFQECRLVFMPPPKGADGVTCFVKACMCVSLFVFHFYFFRGISTFVLQSVC